MFLVCFAVFKMVSWFSWLLVGFNGFQGSFMVFGWFSLFFKTLITPQMYLSELYLGPTVQSRSAALRTDQDLYNKILQIG